MSRFSGALSSFAAGVLSPRLDARDNLNQYYESVRYAQNFIFTPHGTAMKRGGMEFFAEELASRLIPFEPVLGEGYVIAASDQKFRFYGVDGRVEPSGILEVATPFTTAMLSTIYYEAETNVLYLTHQSVGTPRRLRRTAANAFTLETVAWRLGRAPMLPDNLDPDITFTISGSAPNFTLTANADFTRTFTAADVGRYVRMSNNTSQRWFQITAVGTTLTCTVQTRDKVADAPFTTATSDWSLGATSNTVGFRACAIHEGRMIYGGTSEFPDRVWASNSDDYDFFEPRKADLADLGAEEADRGFSRRVGGRGQNAIQWMTSVQNRFFIGAAGGEFSLVAADDAILSPTSAKIEALTARGSQQVRPVIVDSDPVFVQRGGGKLRRGAYSIQRDRYTTNDIALLAEHLGRLGAKKLVLQQTPDQIMWVATNNGQLVGVTIDDSQEVQNFHLHLVGGTRASVLDVEIVRSATEDFLLVHTVRRVGGQLMRAVERLSNPPQPNRLRIRTDPRRLSEATETAFFVDAGLTLNNPLAVTAVTAAAPAVLTVPSHGLTTGDRVRVRGLFDVPSINRGRFEVEVVDSNNLRLLGSDATGSAYVSGGSVHLLVTTVSGLDHLEGETVAILADGGRHPDRVVADGAVTLQTEAAIVTVGLRYQAEFETQRFVGGGRIGPDAGQQARIHRIGLRLHDTLGGRVGVGDEPLSNDVTPVFRDVDDLMGEALPLFTGDIQIGAEAGWDMEPTIRFAHNDPLPAHVLATYARTTVNER